MDLLLKLLIAVLATYRLAQLVSLDNGPFWIFKRLRDWLSHKALEAGAGEPERSPLESQVKRKDEYSAWRSFAHGINCSFCVGVWASGLVVWLFFPEFGLIEWFIATLGVAGGQSIVERYTV